MSSLPQYNEQQCESRRSCKLVENLIKGHGFFSLACNDSWQSQRQLQAVKICLKLKVDFNRFP